MGLLSNKVVLISGASAGIGYAAAIKAAKESASLVLIDSAVEHLKHNFEKQFPALFAPRFISMDLSCENDWRNAIEETLQTFGQLDGLVNCSEEYRIQSIKNSTLQDFQNTLSLNLESTFLGVKYGYLAMKSCNKGGSIVNVSSVLGQRGLAKHTAFAAAKGGSRLMAKAAAIEFGMANTKIRVNSVHPSPPNVNFEYPQDYLMEVASSIVYLLSDGAAFMTGSEVTIDNGYSCALPVRLEAGGGSL